MRAQLLDSHGSRARARDHDQGPGRARVLHGAERRDLPAAPDRHARPRGLHLRGLAVAGRVRGRAAGRRRLPGRRGPDGGQHLPGDRRRPRADPDHEQGRPAGRRARARGGGDRRADRRGPRRRAPDLGQDRRGRQRPARADRAARPAALRRPGRVAARADLRLRVRPVPRRDRLHPRRRRDVQARARRSSACRRARRPRSTTSASSRPPSCPADAARPGRGGLPDHGDQGRHAARRRRHADGQAAVRPPRRCRATATSSRWCSAACSR